jgi:hypothetical protein
MEVDINVIITAVSIFFIMIVIFALSGKWLMFGLKFAIAKMKYKDNLGLMFVRGLGGNYSIPKLIDLSKLKFETASEFQPLSRDMFLGIRVFGCPCVFLDAEDATITTGLFKKVYNIIRKNSKEVVQSNYTGSQVLQFRKLNAEVIKLDDNIKDPYTIIPATHTVKVQLEDGRQIDWNTKIPILINEKPSYIVSKETLKQAIIQSGFTAVLDLFNKNSMLIMILAGGALICAAAGLYISYQNGNIVSGFCTDQLTTSVNVCRDALTALNYTAPIK